MTTGTDASLSGDWRPPASVIVYRQSAALAVWLRVLTVLGAGAVVVGAAASWWVAFAPRKPGFVDTDPATYGPADWAYAGAITAAGVVLTVAAVVGMVWLWRVRKNAEQMAAARHRRERVWTWLGWLVPVVNFWFPYQVVADVHRTSDPDLPPQSPTPRRSAPGWLLTWWLAFVGSNIAALGYPGVSAAELKTYAVLETTSAGLVVLAALLWLRIVDGVQRDQADRARRLGSRFPESVALR